LRVAEGKRVFCCIYKGKWKLAVGAKEINGGQPGTVWGHFVRYWKEVIRW
jgi:hypothetical protein